MKVKILLFISVSVFTPFASVLASDLSEYERHYEELNKLRGQLEKLELEKKIEQVKADIKKAKTPSPSSRTLAPTPGVVGQNPISLGSNNLGSSKLIYVVGTGKDARAVIDFFGNQRMVKNGQMVDGWKVMINGRKVQLRKGKDTVDL